MSRYAIRYALEFGTIFRSICPKTSGMGQDEARDRLCKMWQEAQDSLCSKGRASSWQLALDELGTRELQDFLLSVCSIYRAGFTDLVRELMLERVLPLFERQPMLWCTALPILCGTAGLPHTSDVFQHVFSTYVRSLEELIKSSALQQDRAVREFLQKMLANNIAEFEKLTMVSYFVLHYTSLLHKGTYDANEFVGQMFVLEALVRFCQLKCNYADPWSWALWRQSFFEVLRGLLFLFISHPLDKLANPLTPARRLAICEAAARSQAALESHHSALHLAAAVGYADACEELLGGGFQDDLWKKKETDTPLFSWLLLMGMRASCRCCSRSKQLTAAWATVPSLRNAQQRSLR